jgi:hypothetical protein
MINASRWKERTTLVDVVKVVAKYLNEPDADYAVNFGKDFFISSFCIGFISFSRNRQGVFGEQR